ncbi:ATP-binding protein [Paraburkholderia youngii]|uniref:Uncharacterized protein n=1 Tax=Paraburkholderia youngii TaxID=2782701 RepID=A0A7W8L8Y5_9BURK|nr:RNA-binding domain-containing protein [Paraburkholderia youngii]MBB5402667.1 hypothetical protein [Paraburkholderia youngii]
MSLSAAIAASLKTMTMAPAFEAELLTKDRTKAKNRNEGVWWDYKEIVDLSKDADVSKLARHVLAFHNANGGAICVGIDNKFNVRGVSTNDAADTKLVNDKLRRYVGPRLGVFQDTIELSSGKVIWIIFVPPRGEKLPVAVQRDAPVDPTNGKIAYKRNTFFLRVGDESKACQDPIDIYSLFTNVDASQQEAYALDVDEPYFRLLAPHCERFFGRSKVMEKVRESLQLRHPVISLDGLGGVGKSAIAIELARQFYDAREYEFLISLSAKSRVWQGHVVSRVAGFSGFSEFLGVIAHSLGLPPKATMDEMKSDILDAMKDVRGLVLIDNIEDVKDEQVIRFLCREVPHPVKVLVTSRIGRDMGDLSVPIPEMDEIEATDLFQFELERQGYARKQNDGGAIKAMVEATGGVPLALKWGASIAAKRESLQAAVDSFQGAPILKQEFLTFCFTTMFEELSANARDIALLNPYLGSSWTLPILSIALDISEETVLHALTELEGRGIVFQKSTIPGEMPGLLPLTKEFLAIQSKQNAKLEETVDSRLADALGETNPLVAGLDPTKRAEILTNAIEKKIAEKNLDVADRLAKFLVELLDGTENYKGQFLAGQILYLKGEHSAGKELMLQALAKLDTSEAASLDLAFGHLLLEATSKQDRHEGALHLAHVAAKGSELSPQIARRVVELLIRQNDAKSIRMLLSVRHKPVTSVQIARALYGKSLLENKQLQFEIGPPLIEIFEEASASKSTELSATERREFGAIAKSLVETLPRG